MAAQFEGVGAEPAGDGGTYLHQVRFRTFLLAPAKSSFAIDGKTFEHRKDVLIGSATETTSEADAPVVFVGFGIVAPELGHDEYANVDVRGKIVAQLAGAPPGSSHSHANAKERPKWDEGISSGRRSPSPGR